MSESGNGRLFAHSPEAMAQAGSSHFFPIRWPNLGACLTYWIDIDSHYRTDKLKRSALVDDAATTAAKYSSRGQNKHSDLVKFAYRRFEDYSTRDTGTGRYQLTGLCVYFVYTP